MSLDVRNLCFELNEVPYWDVGVAFGVLPSKLKSIQASSGPGSSEQQWKAEMFQHCLDNDFIHTWGEVVQALQRMKRTKLANKIMRSKLAAIHMCAMLLLIYTPSFQLLAYHNLKILRHSSLEMSIVWVWLKKNNITNFIYVHYCPLGISVHICQIFCALNEFNCMLHTVRGVRN